MLHINFEIRCESDKVTCIYLLKLANGGNLIVVFGKSTSI